MRKTHYTKHLIHLLHLLVAMRFLFSFEKHNHGMKMVHNFPLLVSRFHPAWVQLDEIRWINPRLPLVDIYIIHSYKKFPLIVSFMSKREKAWGNGDKINITGYILKYSCAKKIKKSEVLYCFSGRFDPVRGNRVIIYRYDRLGETDTLKPALKNIQKSDFSFTRPSCTLHPHNIYIL